MAKKSFGEGLVESARQAAEVAVAEPEFWYVRSRDRVTVALAHRTQEFLILWLPGESISKTFWIGAGTNPLGRNPEIELLTQIPDLEVLRIHYPDEE